MDKTIEEITENVNAWTEKYLKGFQFRQYQQEYIVKTLKSVLDGSKLNLIEAPTGTGKSIMVLIMAGVLDKYYGMSSYILCSDLYLWQQYADVIDKNHLYFGKIKGARGNYICHKTNEDIMMADCKVSHIPFSNISDYNWTMSNGWACATTCRYIRERRKAIASRVTLMTYQLYLPYMNLVGDVSPFNKREVVFCDECHNVPNICQTYGSILFERHKDIERLYNFLNYCKGINLQLSENKITIETFDIDDYIKRITSVYNKVMECDDNDKHLMFENLSAYKDIISEYALDCAQTYTENPTPSNGKKYFSKEDRIAYETADWLNKLMDAITLYLEYADTREDFIVKTDNKIVNPQNGYNKEWGQNPCTTYKFAREDAWVYSFLLKHQKANILLSATIGDHASFDMNIGAHFLEQKESVMEVIPSTFDFSKSPIYYIPGNKMSQAYIKTSLVTNARLINKILGSAKHANEKGIIHTGSYKLAKDLYDMLDNSIKSRIYIYSDSADKKDKLEAYIRSNNGILIGPTLTEGVDLPNDGCRVIIILKVPYPYLGDNLVNAKMKLFPNWYKSEASKNIIQGIGRGNRTPDDWSTTYILDGCFYDLYSETKSQYPEELQKRIIILQG